MRMRQPPPPPSSEPPNPWVGVGLARVHRLMTRERFPYLHDLLASTSMQDEDLIWDSLNARMAHWQGRDWRSDTETVSVLAAEARRFDRRYPTGDPRREMAWIALGGFDTSDRHIEPLLRDLSELDAGTSRSQVE